MIPFRTPFFLPAIYPSLLWRMPSDEKVLYLTFDDGPIAGPTEFVLETLAHLSAKATFFCIGKNVVDHPDVYRRIIEEGHAVGNHTQNHLNGWKTNDAVYLENIRTAQKYIDSNLFRPPYGRISGFQVEQLLQPGYKLKTIMWSVLSGDFDLRNTPEQCLGNVILNSKRGDIIVFHDSEKAQERMRFALPRVLKYFSAKGFQFSKIAG